MITLNKSKSNGLELDYSYKRTFESQPTYLKVKVGVG